MLDEVRERAGVGRLDLQAVGEVARQVVALLHGQEPLEIIDEALLESGMLQGDVDVCGERKAHLLVVEQRDETLDHSVPLHLLDPFVDGWRRQAHGAWPESFIRTSTRATRPPRSVFRKSRKPTRS